MFDRKSFETPAKKYRVFPMAHSLGQDPAKTLDSAVEQGYGGAVTNVPFENGFTANPDNLRWFRDILDLMEQRGLGIWIYDEHGYPSGQGGGQVLDGHPELAAKGFYMVRRIAYTPTHVNYHLDDISNKIVWAAKYPLYIPRLDETYVQFDKMEPVPLTDDTVVCDLGEREILYIFCVKNAHEGSHSTHNVSSFKQNINVMDRRAVRRFLDVCFEPVAKEIPDAYKRAINVFTDEPSLHTSYARDYEVWNYALAPWVDGLFEAYEAEYGESMLPTLPLLFEGHEDAYPVRVKFYELVGKLIADAYSGQIAAWCEAHGCGFSGHYLCEEDIRQHVMQYGNYVRVLMNASYPGIDVLCCYPEIYNYNTTKYAQIAVRKKHTNGMMVEICPFADVETFKEAPLDNMTCVMGLLYLGGVRATNSYFQGYIGAEDMRWFNEYVGRLGTVLDGLHNDCDTFIYYGLEDTQAKLQPAYSGSWQSGDRKADVSTSTLIRAVYENGHDFYYADREDLLNAAKDNTAVISGCRVKNIIVPALDVMYGDAYEALSALAACGVNVIFMNEKPRIDACTGHPLAENALPVMHSEEIVSALNAAADGDFTAPAVGGTVLKGKFIREDGRILYMLVNKSRTDATVQYGGSQTAELWNPADGSVTAITAESEICVPAMRTIFVLMQTD